MAQKTEGRISVVGMSEITMIMGPGGYLIGRLEGGNKLIKPRICEITDKKEIHMRPVLGLPPFIVLNDYFASYKVPIREDVIIKLYNQVTDPRVDPGG